ncbi:MAG TPA: flagellar type III secretion system protein FlhB [Acidocella sp.]|jgi:flagellar biosynthetic protein FlhB|uniref:EscU/YscU/HrcU family type III secretion system export apparatus switch protein n=1 Tax=Acidocella sp. TaxID=50710 RepID=UPI002B9BEE70|nr:flagellar type III secretion system protein FlhB [Acidocella sp.]HVE21974.1 flagellar type III secretion system protein FlhB [Acidocella sp.]
MAEGDGQDKRHAPTERRLRQAAEKGQVQRSADLPKAAAIVMFTTLVIGAAAGLGSRFEDIIAESLSLAASSSLGPAMQWARDAIALLAPLLLLVGALSLGASMFSGGWIFSIEPLMPNLSKLNPASGLGQIFSLSHFTETLKAIVKFLVIGGVGASMIYLRAPDFMALSAMHGPSGGLLFGLCLQVLGGICVAITVLAAADVGLQYWLHRNKLRMSDDEIRNEMKDTVGNPHVKRRQRQLARRMARSRQMKRVPEASVVITNPTHFAVAIRYRRGSDRSPLLLAKGMGLMAEDIIRVAREHGVPIVEAPPLARAVYRHVEPDEHVPVALYRACAEVLAYIWRMQQWRRTGGARPKPPDPRNMVIDPEHYVPEPLELG